MKNDKIDNCKDDYEKFLICKEAYKSGDRDYRLFNTIGKTLYNWARYDEALKVFKIGLWYHRNYFYFLYYKSEILNSMKLTKKAIRAYKRAIKAYDNSEEKWLLKLKCNLATNYFAIGKIKKAIELADQISNDYPDDKISKDIHDECKGRISFGTDNFDFTANYRYASWIEYEAREFNNKTAKLYLRVINCLNGAKIGKLEEVESEYDRETFCRVLGATHCELENYELAEKFIRKAVSENRSNENLSLLADCLWLKKDISANNEAEQLYLEILNKDPDNYYALGRMSLVTTDCEMAQKCVDQVLKNRPNNFLPVIWLGDLYFSKNMFEDALRCNLRARCICWMFNPSDISLSIAKCYKMLNNIEQAKNEAERALIENPKNDEAKAFLAQLN